METKIKRKTDNYITQFKDSIKEKMNNLELLDSDKCKELLEFIYSYERLVFVNDDFSKRKRLKNIVPGDDRCSANKACNEQCTRKRKEGYEFCGTHIKGTPNGVIQKNSDSDSKKKVILKLTTNRGIYNYVDDTGNKYCMEDVLNDASVCCKLVPNKN